MKKLIGFFILLIFISNQISAQSSEIKGKILDKNDNEPLLGVNILLEENKIGTQSNDTGEFGFKNISPGSYTLKITYVGHKTKIVNVSVPQNEPVIIKLDEGSVDLNEVVVTGNPLSKDPKDISQSTLTIANLELQTRAAANLGQMLNYAPGISMRSNGTAAARPVIRGFSNNRILILENGLRTGDLSNSSDDHALSSDGNAAEKIEVVRGPASLLYGSSAIGGVINVITESIPNYISSTLDGELNLSRSGNNNEYLGSTDIHYGYKNLGFHLNAFHRSNDDYVDGNGKTVVNSSQKTSGYQLGASFIPSFGIIGASFSEYLNEYDIPINPAELSDPNSEGPIKINMRKEDVRILVESRKLDSFINSFSFKAGMQNYTHDEISKLTGETGTSFGMKSISADLSFNHLPIADIFEGVVGFWGMKQQYSVTGDEALTPDADYNSYAAYILEQMKTGKFNLQFGARYEQNKIVTPEAFLTGKYFASSDKTFNTFSGSFGITYHINDVTSLFSNFANAFRSPTVEELSSYAVHGATGTFEIGNNNLENENNFGIDLGLRIRKENHSVELSTYYNSISNYIFRKPTDQFYDPNNKAEPFNNISGLHVFQYSQTDASIYGFEVKALYEETNNISTTVVMDYVRGKENNSGNNLPQMPPFRFSIQQAYTTDDLWAGINLKLVSEQNLIAENELPTKGYGLVDLYGGFRFITGRYISSITLKIDNLLDQPYKEHLSSIKEFAFMPGRNVRITYRFLF